MKIIVFGANGRQGSRLVTEALDRGHTVTAAVTAEDRAGNVDPRAEVVVADAADLASVAAVAVGHDAALNAIGGPGTHAPAARGLLAGLSRAGVKRLVVVGGASTLEIAPGVRLLDTPDFREEWKAEATSGAESLDVYRAADTDVDWTYVSPGAVLEPGERTGRYRTGDDELLVADDGSSSISMEDFAIALIDELENPQHIRRRFTAAY
jgi:putative NADH-flavin reductase